jgi:hypothetical protein
LVVQPAALWSAQAVVDGSQEPVIANSQRQLDGATKSSARHWFLSGGFNLNAV